MAVATFRTIFDRACGHIEAAFVDRDFVAGDWLAVRAATAAAVDACRTTDEFEAVMTRCMNDDLPLSHCIFVTPALGRLMDARDAGQAPVSLRASWRRGPEWRYLRLPSFSVPRWSMAPVMEALSSVGRDDVVVLDVRLNDGGALSAVGALLGCFVGGDLPFVWSRQASWRSMQPPLAVHPQDDGLNGGNQADVRLVGAYPHLEWRTERRPALELRTDLVVLTGERCHSCGEVFAQAVLDFGRGWVVGRRTAGAVVGARDDFACGEGYRLCLPFVDLVPPSGVRLEGRGVEPTVPWAFAASDETELDDDEIEGLLSALR